MARPFGGPLPGCNRERTVTSSTVDTGGGRRCSNCAGRPGATQERQRQRGAELRYGDTDRGITAELFLNGGTIQSSGGTDAVLDVTPDTRWRGNATKAPVDRGELCLYRIQRSR